MGTRVHDQTAYFLSVGTKSSRLPKECPVLSLIQEVHLFINPWPNAGVTGDLAVIMDAQRPIINAKSPVHTVGLRRSAPKSRGVDRVPGTPPFHRRTAPVERLN